MLPQRVAVSFSRDAVRISNAQRRLLGAAVPNRLRLRVVRRHGSFDWINDRSTQDQLVFDCGRTGRPRANLGELCGEGFA